MLTQDQIDEKYENLKSPLKTIRENCLKCNGTSNEVKLCCVESCVLRPYRFGTDPRRKHTAISEEKKSELAQRLKVSPGQGGG